MADISQYTDKIRHAVYGKEVRGSLADGIEAINTEVEANTKHVNDTSEDIQNFKNEINQAENIRVQDENERKSNETNRINEFDSMKNEFNSLKNNSTEATNNANNAANNANSTATNSENRTSQAINDLTNKVNEAIEKTKPQELAGEILGATLSYINPTFSDCNDFKEPNKYFTWDTGLGAFKNTPLGDLVQNSAIVFEVINYGREGRIQQEFRQTYPPDQSRKWIRNYTSDSNGQWSNWRPEFIGDREINSNDDFNNITNMGCYKVQNINAFTKNGPLTLDNGIDNFGLLEVYVSGVSDNHRVLQIYYPHMPNAVGHRTPVIRMSNDNSWTDWAYIGATPKDIDSLKENINNHSDQISSCKNDINLNTKQIASNSSSINDLYNWVNKNIQMEYISGATSLTLQPNKAYYLDGQHVADITHIDHSAIPVGGKVYFYVASGDPLAHIVFRRQGLCNQDVRVWLPKGQDFWITGNDNGDTIFTLMKIGDSMRFLS
ncbi:pyocin knob domain-containing protein [Clostridium thermobutyricum]|uniref:pyocin knob domain-containing protein n=1 Tax=Clostridium thermobutyricum TaxID=29372 RepID=UPI003F51FA2F